MAHLPLVMFDVNGVLGVRRKGVVTLFDGVVQRLHALLAAGARVGVWTSARAETLTEGLRVALGDELWNAVSLALAASACGPKKCKSYVHLRSLVGNAPPLFIVDDSVAKIADWPAECKHIRNRRASIDDMFDAVHAWLAALKTET